MAGALYYIALAGVGFSLSLALPIFTAFVLGDMASAIRFGFYATLGIFFGSGILLALRGTSARVSQIGAFVLALLIWITFILMATVPFIDIAGLSFEKAIFEAVSGLTTSGASVFATREAISPVLLIWRSQLEWMGGLLTICMVIFVLAPAGAGGLPKRSVILYKPNSTESSGSIRRMLMELALAYTTATIIGAGLLWASGTEIFNALNLAMMSVSTGGFKAFDGDLDSKVGSLGLLVMAFMLFVGASNVFWFGAVREGRWARAKQYREPYIFITLISFIALVITIRLQSVSGDGNPVQRLIEGLFNAVSLLSTSGIESRPGVFALLSIPSLLFVVFFGGCSFSTAGGIKLYRLGAMGAQSIRELNRLIYPSIIQAKQYGQGELTMDVVNAVWSYFVAAIVTVFVGFVALSASGLSFASAVNASVAFFSNAAPFYQAAELQYSQAVVEFGQFSTSGLLIASAIMFLGRLEVIVLLGALNFLIWKRR